MIKITLTGKPEAEAMLKRAGKRIGSLRAVLGEEARQLTQDHLLLLHAQRSGKQVPGARGTGFYEQAAKLTKVMMVGESATIEISKPGMAQRYYGGKIRPTKIKWLTLPVTAQAYGTRARDFRGGTLAFRTIQGGRKAVLFERQAGQRVATRIKVHYVLVRSVNQKADPSVLPTSAAYVSHLVKEGNAFLGATT
jgi:hypothetical protein